MARTKEIEKYFFKKFSNSYNLKGLPLFGDKPDIILQGERNIGIEITNFFLEDGNNPDSEQVQFKRREETIAAANQIYLCNGGKNIEPSFSFNKAYPIRNKDKIANEIHELVRNIEGQDIGNVNYELFKHIPELSFVYLTSEEYTDAKWRVIHSYDKTDIMSETRLQDIVNDKEGKSKKYRPCDAYWLLIVVAFINRAQDQTIPNNILKNIHFKIFEKIIIYKKPVLNKL